MREIELPIYASMDSGRGRAARVPFRLSRQAFVASIVAHVLAGYALSRHVLSDASRALPKADFFLFEMPVQRPPEVAPATPPVEPVPEAREEQAPAPASEPTVVVEPQPAVNEDLQPTEPAPATELAPSNEAAPSVTPGAFIDFDEERRRAANQVVTARSAKPEYLTFSIDDVAAPRPEPEPKPARSIFDPGPNGGRSVAAVGQQRTKVGRKLAELCNALTGGFAAVFQGFGLFSGCASPDTEPSGLFPEVRPEYLDLMPVCVDTYDTAPELAREAPFPTIKCRLVKPDENGVLP